MGGSVSLLVRFFGIRAYFGFRCWALRASRQVWDVLVFSGFVHSCGFGFLFFGIHRCQIRLSV